MDTVKERLALARSFARRGELAQALQLYEQLAGEHPDFADVQNELGLVFHEQGDFERAQASFLRALRINPAYTEAALHLSITWNELGRYDDARRVYEETVARSTTGAPHLTPLAAQKIANLHAELGDAYQQAGQSLAAVRSYREALALGPAYHDVRVRMAAALQAAGEARAAVDELLRVVQAQPDVLSVRITLGLAQFAAGDKAAAVATWRAVLAQDRDQPRAAMYLRLAGETP